MLDERKAKILRAVVQEYIETAQPVGSGRVAQAADINVSSATVRNDMAVLEQEGYLAQPHTSAGRVPTEKGYRFFVDALGDTRLAASEAQQVRSFFASSHGALERMLADTSRLLSSLTHYAAVVVGPPHEAATVRSVQLVGLTPTHALLVVILSNGVIEKETLDLGDDVDEVHLNAATASLSSLVVNKTVAEAVELGRRRDATRPAGAPVEPHERLVDRVLGLLGADEGHESDSVFVGGTSAVADAFEAVGQVREILRILEQQYVVVSLLQDVLDRGLSVAIGTETGMAPLAECAVVVAPYEVDGEPAGSIGVLGPTRMNYPQALAAVEVVSRRLGDRLSEG